MIKKYTFIFGFLIALGAVVISLFYSEVIENVLKYSVGEKVRQLIMT